MSNSAEGSPGATAIRPFTIPVTPEAELEALRARVTAIRWPDQELVTDNSQGPKLADTTSARSFDFRMILPSMTDHVPA